MKADLHAHGLIGFQPYWLKKQGYLKKNLLKEIVDVCADKEIGVCAVISEEDEIPRNSVHDRLGYLKNHYAKGLPRGYETDALGENILVVKKGEDYTYIVNGQTVHVLDRGRQFEHLIIGSNDLPNRKNLDYVVKYAREKGLVSIAEHPFCVPHGGIGEKNLRKIYPQIDAIEGHNSQLIFSGLFSQLPVFKHYSRKLNTHAQTFARNNSKPWVATSDSHRIKDIGISYIEFKPEDLDTSNGEKFLESLKEVIKGKNFKNHCQYESLSGWMNWVSRFMIGVYLKKV